MNCTEPAQLLCPYCGEEQTIVVETTSHSITLVEDCQVCCQPMLLFIRVEEGMPSVEARRENE